MKTTLLLLCMAILSTVSVSAQTATKKTKLEVQAQKETDKFAEILGLDDKQKEKVYNANLEYHKELDQLDKTKLTKEDKLAKKEALRQKQLEHLKTVLKPEQYDKVSTKLGDKTKGGDKPKGNDKPKGDDKLKGNEKPKDKVTPKDNKGKTDKEAPKGSINKPADKPSKNGKKG